jgi:hypothetical protein
MAFTEQLLQHPFSMIVAGPSKAGKTVFTSKLLKHIDTLTTVPPVEILWCYTEYQPNYHSLVLENPRVQLIQGLPDLKELRKLSSVPRLLVLDDLMLETAKDNSMSSLFTRGIHHWNISVVFIVQNVFLSGLRTARINAHYMVLFKNPSDKLQISTLARQLYPKNTNFFLDAFQDATSEPYTYLFTDLTQNCPEPLRLRTNIFPGELTMVYT